MLLSKTRYLSGLQCPKLFWMVCHEKDKFPELSKVTRWKFDQGTEVGVLARKLFPKGIILSETDFKGNLDKTRELLKKHKVLFEPGFMVENLYSRADILVPVGKKAWGIVEVKMGTSIKEINVHDVCFQKHCLEKAGLKIRKCFLMYVNNEYKRGKRLSVKKLFVKEDISKEVKEFSKGIEGRIAEMIKVMNDLVCPEVKINLNCFDPYNCALEEDCWGFLPENSVFELYYGKKAACFELMENGIHCLKDLPAGYKLNEKQKIQCNCAETGKPFIDKKEIKNFLGFLKYPLYYLDFETFNSAIPLFEGVKPYSQIPFQFSLHVQEKKGGKLKHYEFLAKGKKDPRKKFMKELKQVLGSKGSIIVFNESFEKRILRECSEFLPEFKKWVKKVDNRMIDLMIPFRNFSYYHPKQQGSCSLKKVLPAVTGKDYSHLEISDGSTASVEYYNSVYGEMKKEEIKKIREDLLKYCCLDTEGMVWVVEKLGKIK